MWKPSLCLCGLVVLLVSSSTPARDVNPFKVPGKPPTCTDCGKETYGTSIEWMGSPAEAARTAKAQEKLVFVLHVSGHFEDAAFT